MDTALIGRLWIYRQGEAGRCGCEGPCGRGIIGLLLGSSSMGSRECTLAGRVPGQRECGACRWSLNRCVQW